MNHYELLRFLILEGAAAPSFSAGITPPAGTVYTLTDYTFTAATTVPSPVYTWSVGSGDTIVSGQGTASVVVRFGTAGTRSVSLTVTGGGSASASWSGAVTAWTPTVYSGLVKWYDAEDYSTFTFNGPNVSQWRDKSSSLVHANQANTNLQPLYMTNGINGRPAVRGDGYDDVMTWTPFATGTNHSFYIVAAFDTVENRYPQYTGFFGTPPAGVGANDFRLDISANPSTLSRVPNVGDMVLNSANGANNPKAGIPAVYSYLRNGGLYRSKWTFGTIQSVTGSGGYATAATGNDRIFANYVGSISFKISQVVAYNRELTATEEAVLSRYFTALYGVGI